MQGLTVVVLPSVTSTTEKKRDERAKRGSFSLRETVFLWGEGEIQ